MPKPYHHWIFCWVFDIGIGFYFCCVDIYINCYAGVSWFQLGWRTLCVCYHSVEHVSISLDILQLYYFVMISVVCISCVPCYVLFILITNCTKTPAVFILCMLRVAAIVLFWDYDLRFGGADHSTNIIVRYRLP